MIYCGNCETDVKEEVREEKETYPVLGVPTEILAQVTYCTVCRKQIWNDLYEGENLEKAYAAYNETHSEGLHLPRKRNQDNG